MPSREGISKFSSFSFSFSGSGFKMLEKLIVDLPCKMD